MESFQMRYFWLADLCPFTCCWENASYDATEAHEELPQGHVLLCHLYHQRADVILHKDPRNPMTPRCVVYHSLLKKRVQMSPVIIICNHAYTMHILKFKLAKSCQFDLQLELKQQMVMNIYFEILKPSVPVQWLNTGVCPLTTCTSAVLWAQW